MSRAVVAVIGNIINTSSMYFVWYYYTIYCLDTRQDNRKQKDIRVCVRRCGIGKGLWMSEGDGNEIQ